MELLNNWTACICITLIISVIFSLLAPRGRMAGFYKMIISLFIFISIIYPFKDFNTEFSSFDTSFTEKEIEINKEKPVEVMLNNQIKGVLKNHNVNTASVISNVNIVNDSITVESVSIAVSDEYDLKEVKQIIFDELGINAEVHHIGN